MDIAVKCLRLLQHELSAQARELRANEWINAYERIAYMQERIQTALDSKMKRLDKTKNL